MHIGNLVLVYLRGDRQFTKAYQSLYFIRVGNYTEMGKSQ